MKIQELQLTAFGPPAEVLKLHQRDLPEPGPGEVRVSVLAAVVNPADFNVIAGTYGILPPLPATAGAEGVGVVESVGADVDSALFAPGTRVIAPMRLGWWSGGFIEKAKRLIPINEPALSDEQAAMLAVNPPTAYNMINEIVTLPEGGWLAQNAANSGVGRCVIQLAKAQGLRTINLVRRDELVDELTAIGADAVFTAESFSKDAVKEITGGAPVMLGLNATSGKMLKLLSKCLSPSATIVTYGAMSREPFTLGNASLIFKDLRARGYWISRWYQTTPPAQIHALMQVLAKSELNVRVAATYSLADWAKALTHAAGESRDGKILIRPS